MTHRIRTTLLALAAAVLLVPAALAGSSSSPAKPTLEPTKPGAKVTYAMYLSALAGTATTSR